ncbi:hypothetical protein Cme02nite_45170 [Catellatospora methionotrophica]|uniref:Uncharacterized protein n=1 Tax=Catellatospora methionotrophica TaxID=121620 RepID=A0A8J3LNW0_9ACTN|nr:hypothetical protein [Catellatospora methionotrophica]GIG16185.1 hypothetical protein Cme02nite_45170 [Catellatospora methionotrophica]
MTPEERRAYAREQVAKMPPLTAETLAAIRVLMAPGFAAVRAAKAKAARPRPP